MSFLHSFWTSCQPLDVKHRSCAASWRKDQGRVCWQGQAWSRSFASRRGAVRAALCWSLFVFIGSAVTLCVAKEVEGCTGAECLGLKKIGPGVSHHSLLNLVKVRGAHGHLRGRLRGMLPAALGSRWYWINRFPLRSHFDSPANISNPKFELFNRSLLIHLQSKILSFGYIPQLLSLWERTWNDARASLGESALRSLGQIHKPWGGQQKKSELWGFQKDDNI